MPQRKAPVVRCQLNRGEFWFRRLESAASVVSASPSELRAATPQE